MHFLFQLHFSVQFVSEFGSDTHCLKSETVCVESKCTQTWTFYCHVSLAFGLLQVNFWGLNVDDEAILLLSNSSVTVCTSRKVVFRQSRVIGILTTFQKVCCISAFTGKVIEKSKLKYFLRK